MDYNQETVSTFDRNAAIYADKYFDLSQYDSHYDAFLDALPEGEVRLLDLACGPGNVAAYLKARRSDALIVAADRSDAMLEQAKARVPGIEVRNIDCRDVSALGITFHGVAFFFGLSYFNPDDANAVLNQIHRVLAPDGVLLLASVAGEPSDSGEQTTKNGDRVFSFYRRPAEINSMLVAAGFSIIGTSTVDSPANASFASTDVITLARKSG